MTRVFNAKEGVRFLIGNKGMMLVRVAALSAVALSRGGTHSYFSAGESERIQNYWSEGGRFFVSAPKDVGTKGPWQVRLTPEGSTWLHDYNSACGIGKGSSRKTNAPSWEQKRLWDEWIDQRVSFDRYSAGRASAEANSRYVGHAMATATPGVENPGPAPLALVQFAGEPPAFAAAVVPNEYIVRFSDGSEVRMSDNPQMRPNYAYYRFAQGVMYGGTPVKNLPQEELNALFEQAGISGSEQRVMRAVSCLEGGFDSINTYDTGFVSVGLIQFASLSKGAGSLGLVLTREKQNDPKAFEEDFHRYGLDVAPNGSLVALNLQSGDSLEGPAAAKQIILDKRLVAVFEHAGQVSTAFKVAQLQVAKEQYYPSQDLVTLNVNGQLIQGKVSDFVRSEAGMATLMDRKVNTGKLDPLPSVLTKVGTQRGCRSAEDFASHESEVIAALKFRKDFTQDASLTQPGTTQRPRATNYSSRHGSRFGRRHK